MTDRDALLAAVLANPADDTPRLVFADWLDEHPTDPCSGCEGEGVILSRHFRCEVSGIHDIRREKITCPICSGTRSVPNTNAERAEFIRVQCELARPVEVILGELQSETYPSEAAVQLGRDALRRRERELWGAVGPSAFCEPLNAILRRPRTLHAEPAVTFWMGYPPEGWPISNPEDEMRFDVRRGFVSEVACTAADFLRHARGLFAAHPITEVQLAMEPDWLSGEWVGAYEVTTEADRGHRRVFVVGRWPGVRFHLAPELLTDSQITEVLRQTQDQLVQMASRRLGIPPPLIGTPGGNTMTGR